jgi:hypothetical protein
MRWWTHHYIELPRDFWTINHATAEVGSHRTRPDERGQPQALCSIGIRCDSGHDGRSGRREGYRIAPDCAIGK